MIETPPKTYPEVKEKKFSLKKILYRELELRNEISFSEVEKIAKENGYKISNAERRMRELMEKGSVEPILTEKGHIRGYRYSLNLPKIDIYQSNQGALL